MQESKDGHDEPARVARDSIGTAELKTDALAEKIGLLVRSLPEGGVTLAGILDVVEQDGLLILTAFLTLVFLFPVSIPGVSTVFGSAILLIGVCRLLGRNLWLPPRLAQRVLPVDKLRVALDKGMLWVHRLERVSRPHRMNRFAAGPMADVVNNLAIVLGAVLLMAPFGLIPFSNTLPALALLFLAVGLLQRDGLCILLGHITNIATIAYFVFLVVGGGAAIREMWRAIAGAG